MKCEACKGRGWVHSVPWFKEECLVCDGKGKTHDFCALILVTKARGAEAEMSGAGGKEPVRYTINGARDRVWRYRNALFNTDSPKPNSIVRVYLK